MYDRKYSKYSKPKGKSKEEKAEQTKYKEYMKSALGKHYRDISEFRLKKASVTLKQLKFGTIESHKLLSVQIGLDTITLKSSWVEFLLIMLSEIINESKDNVKGTLCKANITNSNFCVDKMYGNYSLGGKRYTIYKIFDTDYYLEAILEPEVIFVAMVHMIKHLEIDIQALKFNIEANNIKERIKEEATQKIETGEVVIVDIDGAYNKFEENIFLVEVSILGEAVKAHRIEEVLLIFCNKVFDKFGLDNILKLENNKYTGICVSELTAPYPCSRIRNSLALVYTNGDSEGILEFIGNAMDILSIPREDIKFAFRGNRDTKHEWEVD